MSQGLPIIFVFSLGETSAGSLLQDVQGRLLEKIAAKATIKHAQDAQTALDLFNGDDNPKAIFVTDPGIISASNRPVSDKLIEFTQRGGTVVLGGFFSSFISPPRMDEYFEKWALPWKSGDYCRTTVYLNQTADGASGDRLPSSYSQKAVFLKDVANRAKWYITTESSVVESHVFPADTIQSSETPVAFTKIGNGSLGYTGDVNAEEGTDAVVLRMIGLL